MILSRKQTELGEEVRVQSSNIDRLIYNHLSKDLYVYFIKGSTYVYKNIPYITFANMINAESVGKYFVEHIKKNTSIHYEKYG